MMGDSITDPDLKKIARDVHMFQQTVRPLNITLEAAKQITTRLESITLLLVEIDARLA